MLLFFRDSRADATTESTRLAQARPFLHAKLLALSGLQIQGVRPKRLYHHEAPAGLFVYFDSFGLGGTAGYIFFREGHRSPSRWLILGIGQGIPSNPVCVEMMRRAFVSIGI